MDRGSDETRRMTYPDAATFHALASKYPLVPVARRLLGDTLTPVTAFRKLRAAGPAFLFESVVGGERLGRYSLLGSEPFLTFTARGRSVEIKTADGVDVHESGDPLADLEVLLSQHRAPRLDGLPPFAGGAVGYVGYDAVRYVEHLPDAPHDDRGLPDLCLGFYGEVVVFDHVAKTITAVAHARTDGDRDAAYRSACDAVDRLVARLNRPADDLPITDLPPVDGPTTVRYASNFAPGGYEAAVERCQRYIQAGDIFQVVLSQRFRGTTPATPFGIYRALRVVNPSPFMFFLDAGPCTLVGASPEILARVEGDVLTVRPLAGTRPRGRDAVEDVRLAAELVADPKERAEHIMLVDLGRNDVGRVSRFGSVELSDLLSVERYSHVMHLSSTVTGRLRDGQTVFDALRACLPAGTLSGAPKVRAMQIIDELEPHRRGPYGGAVGHFGFAGGMDTCIALRTLVMCGDVVDVQAGAGVVADSDPASERRETENKALALLRAVELAERFGVSG